MRTACLTCRRTRWKLYARSARAFGYTAEQIVANLMKNNTDQTFGLVREIPSDEPDIVHVHDGFSFTILEAK